MPVKNARYSIFYPKLAWGAILFLMMCGEVAAMGTMCLFSEVRGVVLQHGKPVQGATIEQEFQWAWKSEEGRKAVVTDGEGKFYFPAITRSSFFGSLLPHEPMIRQTILIKYAGKTHKAWMFDKGNYDENGELKGKPIALRCELDAEPSHKGEVYGICELP